MNLGICTTDFPRTPAAALFREISSMGYRTVQLSFASVAEAGFLEDGRFEIPFSVPEGALRTIREELSRSGLTLTAVNGTFNMAHPDPAVRQEGVRRFSGFCRAVEALGCGLISICTGTRNEGHLWRPHPDNQTPSAWEDMAETVAACAAIARGHGCRLGLETEASNVVDTPEKAARLMDEVGRDALGVILDCANLFHAGQARRENARAVIGHAFDVLGGDILLGHGKDIAEGDGIEFCPTGRGIVDYPYFLERLRAAGYAGDMLLHGLYEKEAMVEAERFFRALLAG